MSRFHAKLANITVKPDKVVVKLEISLDGDLAKELTELMDSEVFATIVSTDEMLNGKNVLKEMDVAIEPV